MLLPILMLTAPDTAWHQLLTRVLLWEVLGAGVLGALLGWLLGKVYVAVKTHELIEESSYLGFIVPAALLVLGLGSCWGPTPSSRSSSPPPSSGRSSPSRRRPRRARWTTSSTGSSSCRCSCCWAWALPITEWVAVGPLALVAVTSAVLGRRMVALWALRFLVKPLHDRAETMFLSCGPIGVSALFYATLAERHTGHHEVFVYTTLAITVSVVVHGLTSAPLSRWLHRREQQHEEASA